MHRVEVVRAVHSALFALAALTAITFAANASDEVTGLWLTDERDGIVEIRPCGGLLCGRIQTILKTYGQKPPLRDVLNEDPKLRSRPICDLPILGKLQRLSANTWGNGWVYDPKRGKTFDVDLTLAQPNVLSVRGYLGVRMLGQTVVWTRAQPGAAKCK
jgi:uncharacterized protein (DUF2147 family)